MNKERKFEFPKGFRPLRVIGQGASGTVFAAEKIVAVDQPADGKKSTTTTPNSEGGQVPKTVAVKKIHNYKKQNLKNVCREIGLLQYLNPIEQVVGISEVYLSEDQEDLYMVLEYEEMSWYDFAHAQAPEIPQRPALMSRRQGESEEEFKIREKAHANMLQEDQDEFNRAFDERKAFHRARLTEDNIRWMMCQLLVGLRGVHQAGCIHRDLSSGNILINKDSLHCIITDLGLTRTVGSSGGGGGASAEEEDVQNDALPVPQDLTAATVGTLPYRSPEILLADLEHGHYDEKCDIWSAGCLFMELCLQHLFFDPPTTKTGSELDCIRKADVASNIRAIIRQITGWPSPETLEQIQIRKDIKNMQLFEIQGEKKLKDGTLWKEIKPTDVGETMDSHCVSLEIKPFSEDCKQVARAMIAFLPRHRKSAADLLGMDWFTKSPKCAAFIQKHAQVATGEKPRGLGSEAHTSDEFLELIQSKLTPELKIVDCYDFPESLGTKEIPHDDPIHVRLMQNGVFVLPSIADSDRSGGGIQRGPLASGTRSRRAPPRAMPSDLKPPPSFTVERMGSGGLTVGAAEGNGPTSCMGWDQVTLNPIASGAAGSIHLLGRLKLNKVTGREEEMEYAVMKRINKGDTTSCEREKKQFERNCAHTNIVRYTNINDANSRHLEVVMECMNLGSFRDVVNKISKSTNGEVPSIEKRLALARSIGFQVLSGLTYLEHFHKTIHRDIKPDNILLNREGRVKLCDFNTADTQSTVTIRDTAVGTKRYFAPEQAKSQEQTFNVDVWATGIVMFQIIIWDFSHPTLARDDFVTRKSLDWKRLSSQLPGGKDHPLAQLLALSMLLEDPKKRPHADAVLTHPFFTEGIKPLTDQDSLGNEQYLMTNLPQAADFVTARRPGYLCQVWSLKIKEFHEIIQNLEKEGNPSSNEVKLKDMVEGSAEKEKAKKCLTEVYDQFFHGRVECVPLAFNTAQEGPITKHPGGEGHLTLVELVEKLSHIYEEKLQVIIKTVFWQWQKQAFDDLGEILTSYGREVLPTIDEVREKEIETFKNLVRQRKSKFSSLAADGSSTAASERSIANTVKGGSVGTE